MELDDYYRQIDVILLQSLTAGNLTVFIAFALVIVLLFCSAMISGAEVAYFSLSQRVVGKLRNSDKLSEQRVVQLVEQPALLLATILIANNFINIAIIVLSSFALGEVIHPESMSELTQFIIEVVAVTFFLVLFGEISPKIYASINNLSLATRMSRPMTILVLLFRPLSKILVSSTNYIEKRLQKRRAANMISLEEIGHAIELTVQHDTDDDSIKQEKEMLKGIIQFRNVSAKQIMTSRMNVTFINDEATFGELLELATTSNYSRIPVFYDDSLDNIKGIIYVKDLLKNLDQPKDSFAWQESIRPPYYVPETQPIDKLLEKFKHDRVHIAIVVDEYGGTAGIVTLEDILEEVIGEIKDEFDKDEDEITYKKIGDNHFKFEAQTLIIDVCRILEIDTNTFDKARGDADSLAGLILEVKKEFPEEGSQEVIENYEFTVTAISERRIEEIEIKLLESEDEDED